MTPLKVKNKHLALSSLSLFQQVLSRVTVVDVAHHNAELMAHIAAPRQQKALKLPDAIVMASAALHQATLITNDVPLLNAGGTGANFVAVGFPAD
jgi:predicted nucleic acid-binding protein